MRLREVSISNFKAIEDTSFQLEDFSVIVGANGAGKSSVLQAMHKVFQSARNRSVVPNTIDSHGQGKGATLSEKEATYMPSPEYRNSGNSQEYGNRQGSPQLDMHISAIDGNGVEVKAAMWIKAARNEGLSVHVPSSNVLVTTIRDQSREFSAYIPGLSGIPLSEEKLSRLIVQRLAAAGDANTVLRNVLLLLKESTVENENGLSQVQRFVSQVMGEVTLEVDFLEDEHSTIQARFQTAEMRQVDPRRFRPLELAGIGFLQVIQIFAYLAGC